MPAAWLKAAELRLICFARLIVASERLKAAGVRVKGFRAVNRSTAAG
jgi:hypothetical protein